MNPQKMIALEEGHSVEAGIPPCAIRPEKRTAIFGEDHVYRYTLDIVWDESLPLCQVIGLNPSTADEFKDDPTVRRCKDFARRFGCGGIVMTNIFAYRDTDPAGMMKHPAPIGERYRHRGAGGGMMRYDNQNDNALVDTAVRCRVHIAAWGVHGAHLNRGREVCTILSGLHTLKCLGVTKDGHPKHPLYLARTSVLRPFSYA